MNRGSERDLEYPGSSAAGYKLRQDRILDGVVTLVVFGGGELAVQELDHVIEASAGGFNRGSVIETSAAAGSGAVLAAAVVIGGRVVEAIEYLDGGACGCCGVFVRAEESLVVQLLFFFV